MYSRRWTSQPHDYIGTRRTQKAWALHHVDWGTRSPPKAVAAGLDFRAIAESEYPTGSVAQSLTRLGELNGLAALEYAVKQYTQGAILLLRDAPGVIIKAEPQSLLIDQSTMEGGTIANYLNRMALR